MDAYKVPTRKVPVRLLLDDGRTLDGAVYTALSGPHGHPQTVEERLNDSEEDFLAVAVGEDHFLLNKSGIMSVQLPIGEEASAEDLSDDAELVPVRVSLTGGIALIGRLKMVMPPGRSRVLDYLNRAPRFLPLFGDERVTFVQRSYIVSVHSDR